MNHPELSRDRLEPVAPPSDHPNASLKQFVQNQQHQGLSPVLNADLGCLEKYAMEDVVEYKISRFLDQIGGFYPDDLHDLVMSKVEKPLISQILRRVGGNQVHASKILGINRNTLRKKMKIYGL